MSATKIHVLKDAVSSGGPTQLHRRGDLLEDNGFCTAISDGIYEIQWWFNGDSMVIQWWFNGDSMEINENLAGGDWNMAFIFPNSWDDDPIWLSYFSRWLKPPTRN